MITDFPGLSFQLSWWQTAVTIPTERRPLQRREEAPIFSAGLKRAATHGIFTCSSTNTMQCEYDVVLLNTMQQEYFAAGILSSKNTVKHKYYAIWILCSWKDKQPDFFAAWILCSTNTVQHEYFFATHAIFPCSTRNLAPTGVCWGTEYRWKGYKSHTRDQIYSGSLWFAQKKGAEWYECQWQNIIGWFLVSISQEHLGAPKSSLPGIIALVSEILIIQFLF